MTTRLDDSLGWLNFREHRSGGFFCVFEHSMISPERKQSFGTEHWKPSNPMESKKLDPFKLILPIFWSADPNKAARTTGLGAIPRSRAAGGLCSFVVASTAPAGGLADGSELTGVT